MSSLKIVGKTEDGKLVVDGWFDLVTTYGIPIEIVVYRLDQENLIPYWLGFYFKAISEGWNPERTIKRLRAVVGDVYGFKFANAWESKFYKTLETLEELRNERRKNSVETSD